jgi:hypothetical protein
MIDKHRKSTYAVNAVGVTGMLVASSSSLKSVPSDHTSKCRPKRVCKSSYHRKEEILFIEFIREGVKNENWPADSIHARIVSKILKSTMPSSNERRREDW